MSTNVRKFFFLVIFDTCDVVYNWSISLLPPIVLDNLFTLYVCLCMQYCTYSDNQKTLEVEEYCKTQVMTLNSPINIRHSNCEVRHLSPCSKGKFNLKSACVNLVAQASPIECLLYLPNVRAIQYKLGPERLTRLGNSNVLYGCP